MLRFLLGLALFCFCLPVLAPVLGLFLTLTLWAGRGCPDAFEKKPLAPECYSAHGCPNGGE
jgi:hypothetical protein